ncbi:hypothetical protein [Pedobacter deserti]|uniref:hypothetical protein n=1 Tax=Pedobacter deserti TaxID=2817382 RepID=UPI00210D6658|nr:hypothetical protein [Pedobacter sp. SYSU D00382]
MSQPLRTFVINLKSRSDRRQHILKEFEGRPEFNLELVEAKVSERGGLGLWLTFQSILKNLSTLQDECILICEDDHVFTSNYCRDYLFDCIENAKLYGMDVLLGGVSWFSSCVRAKDDIYWVESFSGTQFMLIFKGFYNTLAEADMPWEGAADWKIDSLTNKKALIYPFISSQKEFGYSDTTISNNMPGRVSKFFEETQARLSILGRVDDHYKKFNKSGRAGELLLHDKLSTYVINLPERSDRRAHIEREFSTRPEFDVELVKAYSHPVGAYGLWLSIRKIIKMAIEREESVILICEDDHTFTENYSKEFLFLNIIEAHQKGACILSGGTGKVNYVVPISENIFWVDHCLSAQFLVIYRRFFDRILNEPFDEKIIADMAYSRLTSNKMVLYPFVSLQKDFGYSDVTELHNSEKGIVDRMFANTQMRIQKIQQAYLHIKNTT